MFYNNTNTNLPFNIRIYSLSPKIHFRKRGCVIFTAKQCETEKSPKMR